MLDSLLADVHQGERNRRDVPEADIQLENDLGLHHK